MRLFLDTRWRKVYQMLSGKRTLLEQTENKNFWSKLNTVTLHIVYCFFYKRKIFENGIFCTFLFCVSFSGERKFERIEGSVNHIFLALAASKLISNAIHDPCKL